LIPGAQNVSVYQGGTKADVPEPPQENSLSQLAGALAHIQPTLNQATGYVSDIKKQKDLSEGEIAGQKLAQDKNVKDINEAVSKGLLPEGASPTFNFAATTNFLKLRGEQSQMRAREDYYANADLRNSDDPAAFDKWSSKWASDNATATLTNEDGTPKYSALELSKSNFNERVIDGLRGIHSEHIAHRVSEREKFAEETAGNLGTTRLENLLGTGDNLIAPEQRNYASVGRALQDVYYNATTGQAAYGGMNKSKASVAMADIILTKAITENDPGILQIAQHIQTPGGNLAGTKYFKDKADDAQLKIAGTVYSNAIRKDQIGKMNVEGTFDQRMETHRTNFEYTQNETQKKRYVEAGTAKALNYTDLNHMTPQQLQEQTATLNMIRTVDPDSAMQLENKISAARDHSRTTENKDKFPLAEMDTWNAMLTDPGSPSTNKMIDQGLTDKRYGGEEWRRLRAESDKMGQDKMKFAHILGNKLYTNLEENVGKSVYKDPEHPMGAESVYAGQAMFEFRMKAIEYATKNPNANAVEVATVMEPQLESIAKRYNQTAAGLIDQEHEMQKGRQAVIDNALNDSKPEVKAAQAEQVKKATVQTAAIKALDKGKAPSPEAEVKFASSKNEASYQSWKKRYAGSILTDAELRKTFKEGKTPTFQ
jgi:hypothetical protein